MNRPLAFLISLLACAAPARSQVAAVAAEPVARYVGSETCKGCHEEQWQKFQSSPHGLAELDGKVVADQVGCESCHGAGSLHAEAEGDRDKPGFASIRVFGKKLKGEEADAPCLGCHGGGDRLYWEQSAHARRDVACQSCHRIHHPENLGGRALLAAADVNGLCLTCHRDKRAGLSKTTHMPVREGGMTCVDCHNPHGSAGPHQIKADSGTELCVSCHADKRGPFLWEHAPVTESCMNCHEPHGSNNPSLLVARLPFLCQRCHTSVQHPSRLYDATQLPSTVSNSNKLINRSCVNCHSQVHGSNHPSGRAFVR